MTFEPSAIFSYIYKIVSADNPVRIDQICESEIKRVLLGTPFSPPTPEAKLAAKEWGPSGVLIAPKNSHSTSTMLRFPESCFFAFFRLFGSRKARAPEGKNGTKIELIPLPPWNPTRNEPGWTAGGRMARRRGRGDDDVF